MKFFNELSGQLEHSNSKLKKELEESLIDAIELGEDAEEFYHLIEKTFFSDVANNEKGRVNHTMLKTTFESFP